MRQHTLALALALASAPLAAEAHPGGTGPSRAPACAEAGVPAGAIRMYEYPMTHHRGMGHGEPHGMDHGQHHGGMDHGEHHAGMGHGQHHGGMDHREHHAGMGHGEHHGGMGHGEHHGGMDHRERHAGPGRGWGHHRHAERWRADRPGSHHRRMMKALRALYGLDLSQEQRAQVEEIHHELERTLWQLEGPLIDERAHLRKLYAASEWDPQAIGKVYAAIFDLRRQRIEATIDAYNRARAALSEEQREQLREWRDRGRRHRGMGPAHMGMPAPGSGDEQAGHGMMAPRQ